MTKLMDNSAENGSKKDLNRETILKIAQEIFSKYGYKKTTLDDIANAVRKGKSSLYYYFKSSEARNRYPVSGNDAFLILDYLDSIKSDAASGGSLPL